MIVAFCACVLRLEAPWVWALANPTVPSTSAAAAKVMAIFRISLSFGCCGVVAGWEVWLRTCELRRRTGRPAGVVCYECGRKLLSRERPPFCTPSHLNDLALVGRPWLSPCLRSCKSRANQGYVRVSTLGDDFRAQAVPLRGICSRVTKSIRCRRDVRLQCWPHLWVSRRKTKALEAKRRSSPAGIGAQSVSLRWSMREAIQPARNIGPQKGNRGPVR